MDEEFACCNGIAGESGEYLIPPLTPDQIVQIARGLPVDAAHLSEIQWLVQRRHEKQLTALPRNVDPGKLHQAGWGVIFPHGEDTAQREGLTELLKLRGAQSGDRYREFAGADGYQRGESKIDFLARHGMGPGVLDPKRIPYYLLIAGSPEEIPYEFQFQLGAKYAVGRVHFDAVDDYATTPSIARAELQDSVLPREARRPRPGDPATQRSADHLITPLAEHVKAEEPAWQIELLTGPGTEVALCEMFGDRRAPRCYLRPRTTGVSNGDPRQRRERALLCQDWPIRNGGRQGAPRSMFSPR
jgi:hypothetical protein